MNVAPVATGARGADMVTRLTSESAARLRAAGLDYVVRYVGGLSREEMADVLGAGLGLQLVTYSRAPGWTPSGAIGAQDGIEDLKHLAWLQVPAGMLVWIDLEGAHGTAADVAAWANARAYALVKEGYIAGLYVGDSCVLNAEELYALTFVTRYWRAFNSGIPEPKCGFCQFQAYPPNQMLAGVQVDRDHAQPDYVGRVPMMLVSDALVSA